MIQNFHPAHGGVVIRRTPDSRRHDRRPRLAAIVVILAVGLSGGLLQQFHDQANLHTKLGGAQAPIPTGPLAYFPR